MRRSRIESVAERAALSARTVYRHFLTRRDLLTAALWERLHEATGTRHADRNGRSRRRCAAPFGSLGGTGSSHGRRSRRRPTPTIRNGSVSGRAWRSRPQSRVKPMR
ncbi:MAG: TetR family transcriptional regulator [Gemmatimonadetes bacterium]|nr:TetR family transcriptional regulator [Gemmatimonadota bacterium]